jgi:glycosyltransferase involved in cell wall biosynthesis
VTTEPRGCILFVQPVAERGGSDQCLLRMVRQLAPQGWRCHVVTPAPHPLAPGLEEAGATLHVVPMRRITKSAGSYGYWAGYALAWPVTVVRLAVLARRVGATVVQSNSLHSWYGWAAAAVVRRPHVWHAREIVVQSGSALRLERWLCRHFATTVVAVSRAVADQLPGAPVVVVHDVPDPAEFGPGNAGRFRGRVGIGDDVPLVGAAGRIDTWKGFDVVLDAAGAIRASRPDAQVVVAGAAVPGKEGYAQALAERASRTPGVHWLGPRDDMPDLLADLDVLVLASTEPEPFGMVLAEALASGVPVVATEGGGPREMLGEVPADRWRLVAPRDAGALAAAVAESVPAGASSTARRRARPPVRLEEPTSFSSVFDAAARRSPPGLRCRWARWPQRRRWRRWRRRGTATPGRPRSAPS